MGGAHHHLVDHHDSDSGAGDRIDRHRIGIAGTADHYPLADLDALVLGVEGVQFRFGNTDQQDRFVVFEHIGVPNYTFSVENHLHVDRLAGIGRNIDHIQALEYIAEHLVATRQGAHFELPLRF
ncbi:hypothetical protein D9M68_899190 [compost metagenome]